MKRVPLKKTDFFQTIDKVLPGGSIDKGEIVLPKRRIYLERISLEGLNEMYEYSCDPLFYQYLERSSPPRSITEMETYLKNFINQVGT